MKCDVLLCTVYSSGCEIQTGAMFTNAIAQTLLRLRGAKTQTVTKTVTKSVTKTASARKAKLSKTKTGNRSRKRKKCLSGDAPSVKKTNKLATVAKKTKLSHKRKKPKNATKSSSRSPKTPKRKPGRKRKHAGCGNKEADSNSSSLSKKKKKPTNPRSKRGRPAKQKTAEQSASEQPQKPLTRSEIYSAPAKHSLKEAEAKCASLTEAIEKLSSSHHPAHVLKCNTFEQELQDWTARKHRLEREIDRWGRYGKKFMQNTHLTTDDVIDTSRCVHCGSNASLRINMEKRTQQCTKCFREDPCYDVVHTTGDRLATSKQNHYYPENHWNEALNHAQGMRCGDVPADILRQVNEKLYNVYHFTAENHHEIPFQLVVSILKKLHYGKCKRHKVLIWCHIVGRTPVRMSVDERVAATDMFYLYLRAIDSILKDPEILRQNLLSYESVAYRILQILSRKDPKFERHMVWYDLLKGEDRKCIHDNIWKQVCKKNNWPFIPAHRKESGATLADVVHETEPFCQETFFDVE